MIPGLYHTNTWSSCCIAGHSQAGPALLERTTERERVRVMKRAAAPAVRWRQRSNRDPVKQSFVNASSKGDFLNYQIGAISLIFLNR